MRLFWAEGYPNLGVSSTFEVPSGARLVSPARGGPEMQPRKKQIVKRLNFSAI